MTRPGDGPASDTVDTVPHDTDATVTAGTMTDGTGDGTPADGAREDGAREDGGTVTDGTATGVTSDGGGATDPGPLIRTAVAPPVPGEVARTLTVTAHRAGSLIARHMAAQLRRPVQAEVGDLHAARWGAVAGEGVAVGSAAAGLLLGGDALCALADLATGGPGEGRGADPTPLEISLAASLISEPLRAALAGMDDGADRDIDVRGVRETDPTTPVWWFPLRLTSEESTIEIRFAVTSPARDAASTDGSPEGPLAEVPVELTVRFDPVTVATTEIAGLTVGDVLRLDHPLDRPLTGTVDGHPVVLVAPGRTRRRVAARILQIVGSTTAHPTTPPPEEVS